MIGVAPVDICRHDDPILINHIKSQLSEAICGLNFW